MKLKIVITEYCNTNTA